MSLLFLKILAVGLGVIGIAGLITLGILIAQRYRQLRDDYNELFAEHYTTKYLDACDLEELAEKYDELERRQGKAEG